MTHESFIIQLCLSVCLCVSLSTAACDTGHLNSASAVFVFWKDVVLLAGAMVALSSFPSGSGIPTARSRIDAYSQAASSAAPALLPSVHGPGTVVHQRGPFKSSHTVCPLGTCDFPLCHCAILFGSAFSLLLAALIALAAELVGHWLAY